MIEYTAKRKNKSTIELEQPEFNLPLVEMDQLILYPVREVVSIEPSQLDAQSHLPKVRRSTRITQEPNRYEDNKIMVAVEKHLADHPGHRRRLPIDQIKLHGETPWKKEIRTTHQKKVWTLTDLPPGRKTIATRWLLQNKTNASVHIEPGLRGVLPESNSRF